MKKLLMLFMVLLMSCSTDNGLSVEEVTVYDTVTVENEIDVEIKKEVEKLVNVYDTFPTGKLVEIFDTTEIKIKRYVYDTIKYSFYIKDRALHKSNVYLRFDTAFTSNM